MPAVLETVRSHQGTIPEPEAPAKRPDSITLVTWAGPDDPDHPYNWSGLRKWVVTGMALLATFVTLLNGSIITVAHEPINEAFGISDAHFAHSYWPISSWGVGGALFSLTILPLMEDFGIRTVFLVTYGVFVAFLIPAGFSQNFATLIIVRFFSGGCVAILANTVSAILTNVFDGDRARTPALSLYILLYLAATSMGPVLGAAIYSNMEWRWICHLEAIWTGALLPVFWFCFPECRASVLLQRKAAKMRSKGIEAYTAEELDSKPIMQILVKSIQRPLYMLCTESVVFVATLWSAFSVGTIYLFTQSVEQVYGELYGWNAIQAGYVQVALVVGDILGTLFCICTNHWYYNSAKRNTETPGLPIPEARLYQAVLGGFFGVTGGMFIYAWTSFPDIHWMGPTVGLSFVGFGTTTVVMCICNYLVDAYSHFAASAIAAIVLGENMMLGFLPLAAMPMYSNIGLRWASSLLGFISLGMVAMPLCVLKWGRVIRQRSPFMKEAAELKLREMAAHSDHDVAQV